MLCATPLAKPTAAGGVTDSSQSQHIGKAMQDRHTVVKQDGHGRVRKRVTTISNSTMSLSQYTVKKGQADRECTYVLTESAKETRP